MENLKFIYNFNLNSFEIIDFSLYWNEMMILLKKNPSIKKGIFQYLKKYIIKLFQKENEENKKKVIF